MSLDQFAGVDLHVMKETIKGSDETLSTLDSKIENKFRDLSDQFNELYTKLNKQLDLADSIAAVSRVVNKYMKKLLMHDSLKNKQTFS